MEDEYIYLDERDDDDGQSVTGIRLVGHVLAIALTVAIGYFLIVVVWAATSH